MSTVLLKTKLYVPAVRPELVPRPYLIDRLNEGLNRKLILVAAPAGYGKTTLLNSWAAGCGQPVAWLSIDDRDNEPTRFLAYLIAAIQTIEANLGQDILSALQSSQSSLIADWLPVLVNQLDAISRPFVLVLDDYHLITTPAIHQALAFVLEHQPAQMHLAIATRKDPPLPLPRLRARGQLTELRQTDLRFTTEETAAFLQRGLGVELSPKDVGTLVSRTEGWIAGLQMAALSIRDREDVSRLIAAFGGSHEYIVDYFAAEVLDQQPEPIKTFLLQTSILDRLCGSLCDAVTLQANGQHTLEQLQQANLFVVPLDDERTWYRYHQLFADLLQNRLQLTLPEQIIPLHQKASQWYEQNGWIKEAIEHSLLARDYERAILLINQAAEQLFGYGDRAAMARWIHVIPEDQLRRNLNLEVLRAASLAMDGHIQEAETCLKDVEKWLAPVDKPDVQQTILAGRILSVHAMIASYRGDANGVLSYAPQALEKLAGDPDLTWRSWNLVNLSNVSIGKGDMEAANRYLMDSIAAAKATNSPDMALTTTFYYVLILWIQGCIREASQACQEGLAYVAEHHLNELPRAGALFMIWGLILCERHELASAEESINQGYQRVKQEKSPLWLELADLIRLRFLVAKGDLAGADQVVKEAIQLFSENEIPEMLATWIRGFITWFWVLQGQFAEAEKDFQQHNIRIDGEVGHPYYNEYLSLAMLLQAKGDYSPSINLLEHIIFQAEIGKQFRWAVIGDVLLAMIYQSQGDMPRSLTVIEKAFAIAELEGNIQVFLDEGAPMIRLLHEAVHRKVRPAFAHKLLASFPQGRSSAKSAQATAEQVEQLSQRELEVLRLIAEGLSNQEIAARLYLSLRTIKFHTGNIYGKLGVKSRTEAVSKARILGLLSA